MKPVSAKLPDGAPQDIQPIKDDAALTDDGHRVMPSQSRARTGRSRRPPLQDQASGLVRSYRRHEPVIVGLLSLMVFGALWELVSRLELVNPLFASRPSLIWHEFIQMYFVERDIYPHLQASAYDAGIGFAGSVILGILLGILLGRVRRVRYALEPFLMAMYSTPTVAFLPLLIMWVGIGSTSRIILIFTGAIFPVLITTGAGVENIDRKLIETARAFRASRSDVLWKVILPGSVPYILAGIRLAVGRVLIMLFVAEMFMASRGIGFLVTDAGARFQSERLFVGVLTLALVGVLGTHAIRVLEQKKFSYAQA